ncbi:MAG: glycosyl hydrolase family 18 protein, partial [Terriglobia bacterium]
MKRKAGLTSGLVVLVLFGLAFAAGIPPALGQATGGGNKLTKRIIGDYGYWSRTQNPSYSSAQIPFAKLTHINHAGVSFDASGHLVVPAGFLEPQLILKAHAAGDRVLLLLGGDFSALETGPGVLVNLVMNLQKFIHQNGYDGVDIDWEYPSTPADTQAWVALFTALRTAFPGPAYQISADVPPWGGTAYDFPQVEPLVDFFNVMMYDCAGPWTDDAQLNSAIFPDPNNPQPYE